MGLSCLMCRKGTAAVVVTVVAPVPEDCTALSWPMSVEAEGRTSPGFGESAAGSVRKRAGPEGVEGVEKRAEGRESESRETGSPEIKQVVAALAVPVF